MIAAFLFAFQQVPLPIDEGMVGAFRHGAWDGICWRDGNLAGRSQEECRAWWHRDAPIELSLERVVTGMSFYASSWMHEKVCSTSISIPRRVLRDRRRTMMVTARLMLMLRQQAVKCHVASTAAALRSAEIGAVLHDTDGLIHLDLDN